MSQLKKSKPTREAAAVLLPIVVAAISGLWVLYTHFFPKPERQITQPPIVSADHGGIAIGGDVSGSAISTGGGDANLNDPTHNARH